MRKSNWKSKVLMAVALIIGVIAAIFAAAAVNRAYPPAAGLTFFGVMACGTAMVFVIGTKIFKIGR